MILVDTNLLVYAHITSFDQHDAARDWLDGQLAGSAKVGLPWESLIGYMRIVTHPRAFESPLSTRSAHAQVVDWLSRPPAWTPMPTDSHAELLATLVAPADIRGHLIPDAHLAAIAIGHGLTLMTNDGDFARFPSLRWENPLA